MTKASIRDLRYHFDRVEARLVRGEEIEITRRGRVVARLSPPERPSKFPKRPDFLKRMKKILGDRSLPPLELDRQERF